MQRVRFKSQRKGQERKGQRKIESEALAETEKIPLAAPAGNRIRDPGKRG